MRIAAPLLVVLALCTSGCIYKLDVQQGNLVTQEMVSKLKKGMTKPEVTKVSMQVAFAGIRVPSLCVCLTESHP